MGYNTRFELEYEGCVAGLADHAQRYNLYELGELLEYGESGDGRWYDWQRDMLIISKEWSKTLFHLTGYGEDKGDWWVCTFLGGKCHLRTAVVAPYDPCLLEESSNG